MSRGPKHIVFTAGSGRSGTATSVELFRRNVARCIALHEPFVDPTPAGLPKIDQTVTAGKILEGCGFGRALRWFDDDDPRLDRVIDLKARAIRGLDADVYFEANHAFVKSLAEGMVREFPDLAVIHLTRDPLEVARSYANRVEGRTREKFLEGFARWNAVPGFRKNGLPDPPEDATPFQMYLWEWVEVELRVSRFLDRHPGLRVVRADVREFGEPRAVGRLFDALGIPGVRSEIRIPPAMNANPRPTRVSEADRAEARELLKVLPSNLLGGIANSYGLQEIRGACGERS